MSAKVEVHLRCRPCAAEGAQGPQSPGAPFPLTARSTPAGTQVTVPQLQASLSDGTPSERDFLVDGFWPGETDQAQLFQAVALPVLARVLDGYNGTFICYGPSSSGKTHTIFGPDVASSELQGIVPRAARHLFQAREARQASKEIRFFASYLEIYLDKTHDLLAPDSTANLRPVSAKGPAEGAAGLQPLQLRQTEGGTVYAEGLTSVEIGSPEQLLELLTLGLRRRATYSTALNQRSSRSHAVLAVLAAQTDRVMGATTTSVLSFCDLAGSERLDRSLSEGVRKLEAASINRSLSALGNVIQSLVRGDSHVPYRDSKLTRLLQDALGGNSYTTMICTVHPTRANYDETLATVSFAHRCRNVVNQPRITVVDLGSAGLEEKARRLAAELADARAELDAERRRRAALEDELEAVRGGAERPGSPGGYGGHGAQGGPGQASTGQGSRAPARPPALPGAAAARLAEFGPAQGLREANLSLQRQLEARGNDLLDLQARLRAEQEKARKQAAEQKDKVDALRRQLEQARASAEASAREAEQRHSQEIASLLADSDAVSRRCADVMRDAALLPVEATDAARAKGETERALRAELEAEKARITAELDALMLRQRDELTRHYHDEMELLRHRLQLELDTREREGAELRKSLEDHQQALLWLSAECAKLQETIYACLEGRYFVSVLNTSLNASMINATLGHEKARVKGAVEIAPADQPSALPQGVSTLIRRITGARREAREEAELLAAQGGPGAGGAVESAAQGGPAEGAAEPPGGFVPAESTLSLSFLSLDRSGPRGRRSASRPGSRSGSRSGSRPGSRAEQAARPSSRGALASSGLAASATMGGVRVAPRASVAPARPASATGFSTVKAYSRYTVKPYEYRLGEHDRVRKARPSSVREPARFVTSFGSPAPRFSAEVGILNNEDYYISSGSPTVLSPKRRSGYYDGVSVLFGKEDLPRKGLTAEGRVYEEGAPGAQDVPAGQPRPVSRSPSRSPPRRRAIVESLEEGPGRGEGGEEGRAPYPAAQAPEDPERLTGTRVNSYIAGLRAGEPGAAAANSTSRMLLRELNKERQRSARLQASSFHQQKLLASGERGVWRGDALEIYEK